MNAKERHAALARKSLEQKLGPLRSIDFGKPRNGWIRAIRDSLGISTRQLARRMGVVQSRIVALEKAESSGSTTLKSLREAAEALDCTLVYALVPVRPLDETLRERARKKAVLESMAVSHGMLLEGQALTSSQVDGEIERLTDAILAEPLRLLWEEE